MDLSDPRFIGAGTAASIFCAVVVAVEIIWKPIRGFLHRHDPPPAKKTDTDALSQQIKDLDRRFIRVERYLGGLPEAKNPTVRAAYEEGYRLQEEGDRAQDAGKHRKAIECFSRAIPLAEDDLQRVALHLVRGNSYDSIGQTRKAESEYAQALSLCEQVSPPEDAAWPRAVALMNLAASNLYPGAFRKAHGYLEQAVAAYREIGRPSAEGIALLSLAIVNLAFGETAKATEYFRLAQATLEKIEADAKDYDIAQRALEEIGAWQRDVQTEG